MIIIAKGEKGMNFPYMNMNPYQNIRANTNSINWVQGIEGAKAFTLMPKENVILMDSEVNDKFYIKICDDIGRCTLRVFKYHEEVETPVAPPADLSEYVKKSELQALLNEMLGGSNESTISGTKQAKQSGTGTAEQSGKRNQ